MDIGITGSHGMLARALGDSLLATGSTVRQFVRSDPGPWDVLWDPAAGRLDPAHLEGLGAVVHLAGAGIGDNKWTEDYKRQIMESRIQGTQLLASTMAAMQNPPPVLLSASGVNYYGDRGDEELTEASDRGSQFLSKVCRAWEHEARAAEGAGVRVALMRTAPVMARRRGVLPRLARLFNIGLGGRLGSGDQWFSWISIDDWVRAVRFLLEHDVAGPVNLASPSPVTNREFTKTLGRVLRRPTFFTAPAPLLRRFLGKERAGELLLGSLRVLPAALTNAGFEFRYPQLEPALRWVLGK